MWWTWWLIFAFLVRLLLLRLLYWKKILIPKENRSVTFINCDEEMHAFFLDAAAISILSDEYRLSRRHVCCRAALNPHAWQSGSPCSRMRRPTLQNCRGIRRLHYRWEIPPRALSCILTGLREGSDEQNLEKHRPNETFDGRTVAACPAHAVFTRCGLRLRTSPLVISSCHRTSKSKAHQRIKEQCTGHTSLLCSRVPRSLGLQFANCLSQETIGFC